MENTPDVQQWEGFAPAGSLTVLGRRLPWQLVLGALVCMAAIVGLDAGYLSLSSRQMAARERIETTVTLDRTLDRIQAQMVDAETGVRGYALVGREVMLDPYYSSKIAYQRTLDDIGTLVKDDATQRANLDSLRAMVAHKWDILQSTIDAIRQSRGLDALGEGAPGDPGKSAMDAIRAQVLRMQSVDGLARDELRARFERGLFWTRMFVFATSGLVLLSIVLLYLGARHFVNEQARAAQAIQQSEERYRALTELAPQIVWMTDARGSLTFGNQRWIDYTGLSLEESSGEGAQAIVHPEDWKVLKAAWRRARDNPEPFDMEVRLRRYSDGKYRWHLSRGRPMRDARGRAITWFGIAIDIEERKQSELKLDEFNAALAEQVIQRTSALEERTRQLQALNRNLIKASESERVHLARELHDELGSHLSVAMMDLTMISRGLAKEGPPHVVALTERLAETLKATTQISRRIIVDLRPVTIGELGLAGALDSYCAQFSATTGLPCERDFDDNIPELLEEAAIALFRMAQESLSNVVKYAEATLVRVSLRTVGDAIVLCISDDGRGVPAGATRKRGSHGLIGIQERADAFGGAMTLVAGIGGRGTGIRVELPLAMVRTQATTA